MGATDPIVAGAEEVVRRSLPRMLNLYRCFIARRARDFQILSEQGTANERMMLTVALMIVSALAAIAIALLDSFNVALEVLDLGRLGAWTAIIPLVAVWPAYLVVRRLAHPPSIHSMLNLGLVTATCLAVVPGLFLALATATPQFKTDLDQLRKGLGADTRLGKIYCGQFEDQAEGVARFRQLAKNNDRFELLSAKLQENIEQTTRSAALMLRLKQQVEAAPPDQRQAVLLSQFPQAKVQMLEGLRLAKIGDQLDSDNLALLKFNLAVQLRLIALQERATDIPLRLAAAYPVTATIFCFGLLCGIAVWVWAGIVLWKLTVPVQPKGVRRATTAVLILGVFLASIASFALVRAGLMESWLQPEITDQQVVALTKVRFDAAKGWCGALNNFQAW